MTSHRGKNILLVGNWRSDTAYAWKMIEHFWLAIARTFADRQTILCFPEVATVSPEITDAGIKVVEFSFDFRNPRALIDFCLQHDIGLIYFTDRPYTSSVYRKLRAKGVRHIVIHDHAPGQRTRPSVIKSFWKKANARIYGADSYIACSEHVLNRLITVGCLPPNHCHLARNGLDLTPFSNPNPKIRKELALPPEVLLVVSCSRLHPYKRVSDIVDAAARVTDLPLHFIHIGDGPEFNSLRDRIRDHGLDARFTLLGKRDNVPELLSGCDIAVHASDGEGLCLAMLEFMASGLALAVTDEPTVSGIIEPGVTALTFTHRNVAALASTLRTLGTNSQLRQRLGQAARNMVEAQFRIENTVSSVISALKSTVAR